MTGPGAATAIPDPGFADPTREAQSVFRAVLDALAHPTRSYPLSGPARPPAGLGRGLGAVALTLLDEDCSTWLGGRLGADAAVAAWLTFHTGTRLVTDPVDAQFVLADPRSLPPLAQLQCGTDEAPHRSATVLLDVRGCSGTARFRAAGPGIDGAIGFAAPWADAEFFAQWTANTATFPRGVDLVLVDEDSIAALPRTTRLHEAGSAPTGSSPTSSPREV